MDRPALEIEITPEMIEAANDALGGGNGLDLYDHYCSHYSTVFRAMVLASPDLAFLKILAEPAV